MNATTNHQSLKNLSKSILNRLENKKFIEFNPTSRTELQDQLFKRLSKSVLTEEDLTLRAREDVGSRTEELSEQKFSETDAFQSQKKALRSKYADNAISGFYLKTTLRDVTKDVGKFLFDTDLIEDVFESDEAIEKLVLETIQGFDESKLS